MTNELITAKVQSIPKCQYPGHADHDAKYDASILVPGYGRTWGYWCQAAFQKGQGSLGTGLGQRLVLDLR